MQSSNNPSKTKYRRFKDAVCPMKDAIVLTEVYTIDTAEIEELHQLRITSLSLTENLNNSEKTISMKNMLIENLTNENEKLKADLNGLI